MNFVARSLHFTLTWKGISLFLSLVCALLLGVLAVNDAYNTSNKETKQGETPGASSDLNRLDKDPIYVGGLPRSRVVRCDIKLQNFRVPDFQPY